MLKKIFGVVPKREADGSYSPSKTALKLATKDKTDFENIAYEKYQGNKKKILVVFSEDKNLTMENGKMFSTGNHPVEALVPMLHLKNAGFEFEIATSTGRPAVIEQWAFPKKDEHVTAIYNELKPSLENPKSLESLIGKSEPDATAYAAIFFPGGHGAMIGLPEDENIGKVLHWAHQNELYTITICHGPAALLATTVNNQKFLYDGYKMAVFPDSVDKVTPKIGYLPGKMPWWLGEKLKNLGADIINTKADKTICLDRKLISGASPLASNELGKLAAKTLLDEIS